MIKMVNRKVNYLLIRGGLVSLQILINKRIIDKDYKEN
jgi:putative NADH-flavin reductase